MTPGGNNLNRAMRLIRKQSVTYYQFAARITNAAGLDVNSYVAPITLWGSVQPVPQNYYANLGLDFQKEYITFYCSKKLIDIRRDVSTDLIHVGEKIYGVESATDWYDIDGWMSVLAVAIEGGLPPSGPYVEAGQTVYIVEPF